MCLVAGCAFLTAAPRGDREPRSEARADNPAATQPRENGLRFEPNLGQFDPLVRYQARGEGYALYLTREGATFAFSEAHHRGDRPWHTPAPVSLRMRLVGARAVEPTASERTDTVFNYYLGNDPSRWRTGVESFGRVRYTDVVPGVDVDFYGRKGSQLEYDLRLAPGVDPAGIAMRFEGVQSLDIDGDGSAVLRLAGGHVVRQPPPVVYQASDAGARTVLPARYEKSGADGLAFVVSHRDERLALVIDPALAYSTYLGGNATEYSDGVAVDATGAAYVTGQTQSLNFPTPVTGVNEFTGVVYVTKFKPSGAGTAYSTVFGGTNGDTGYGVAVDATGNAYVTGLSPSGDFPIVNGPSIVPPPVSSQFNPQAETFVAKLNATGTLVASTFAVGSSNATGQITFGYGVAVTPDGGRVHITGASSYVGIPFSGMDWQGAPRGGVDAYYMVLSTLNGHLAPVFQTYIGGSGNDYGTAIALDPSENAYIVGTTASSDFPTCTPGVTCFRPSGGGGSLHGTSDAFAVKFTYPGGGLPIYSQYLGGSAGEGGSGVAADAAGNGYFVGWTRSTDFPTASPVYASNQGMDDVFLTKINPTGSAMVYSTYLGGSSEDGPGGAGGGADFDFNAGGNGVTVDAAGEAIVVGTTFSPDFPVVNGSRDTPGSSWSDGFATKFNATGSAVVYSTYLGDPGTTMQKQSLMHAVAVDPLGNAYVAGETSATDFPIAGAPPFQPTFGGGLNDMTLTKLNEWDIVGSLETAGTAACNGTADETATGLVYSNPGPGFSSWRDVLALLYGGLETSSGKVDCASSVRTALVNGWGNMFQTACANAEPACNDSVHGGKLWHAFRPDDGSSVAQVFAALIGLSPAASATAVNGFGTSPYCNALNWDVTKVNTNCAAGPTKQFVGPGGVDDGTGTGHRVPPPNTYGAVAAGVQPFVFPTSYQDNDPIRRPCIGNGAQGRAGEDVCNDDGQLGVVVSVPALDFIPKQNPGLVSYTAAVQCSAGTAPGDAPRVFKCAPRGNGTFWATTACPNNDMPIAFGCLIPIGSGPSGRTSQCLANKSEFPAFCFTGPCGTDGRVYNVHGYNGAADTVHYVNVSIPETGFTQSLPFTGAFARAHERETVPANLSVCANDAADVQIGCLVHADRCSLGLGDAASASAPAVDNAIVRVNQVCQVPGLCP